MVCSLVLSIEERSKKDIWSFLLKHYYILQTKYTSVTVVLEN